MVDLELTRSREDRRRFDLPGFGSVRKLGLFGSAVEITTAEVVLRTERRGVFRTVVEARDQSGAIVGDFRSNALATGGQVRWRGESFELRSERWWGTRYVLTRADRPVLRLRCSGWGGRKPVTVTLEETGTDPALVLFLTAVVQTVVSDSSSASAGGAVG